MVSGIEFQLMRERRRKRLHRHIHALGASDKNAPSGSIGYYWTPLYLMRLNFENAARLSA